MHFTSPRQWIDALWLLFGAYWLASALKRKKTKQRETILQRFAYTLPLGLGFYFLYEPHPPYGWLSAPFLPARPVGKKRRSEEHTSELQSRGHLVCRLL